MAAYFTVKWHAFFVGYQKNLSGWTTDRYKKIVWVLHPTLFCIIHMNRIPES